MLIALDAVPFLPLQACGGQRCCPHPPGPWLQLGFPLCLAASQKKELGVEIHSSSFTPCLGAKEEEEGRCLPPKPWGPKAGHGVTIGRQHPSHRPIWTQRCNPRSGFGNLLLGRSCHWWPSPRCGTCRRKEKGPCPGAGGDRKPPASPFPPGEGSDQVLQFLGTQQFGDKAKGWGTHCLVSSTEPSSHVQVPLAPVTASPIQT